MDTTTNAARSVAALSKPLEALSNTELLASTRRLIGRSNQLQAELLAHLGEVEARGIHRTRACSSLYVYCIYELRLSEDEAYRRVAGARPFGSSNRESGPVTGWRSRTSTAPTRARVATAPSHTKLPALARSETRPRESETS